MFTRALEHDNEERAERSKDHKFREAPWDAQLPAHGCREGLWSEAVDGQTFLAVESQKDPTGIGGLEPSMARNGAAWVVFPKGRKDLPEMDVIRAGVAAGLVDNKVVRFSETHTAFGS